MSLAVFDPWERKSPSVERTTDFWLQPAEHSWRPRPTLTGRDHTSFEVWDEERERILVGDWVAFGRSEEVAGRGDYVVRDVAGSRCSWSGAPRAA